jgi:uncharacterized protein with NRDE domain
MCTLVILRRPGHAWPLVLAANRDEMTARAWRPPGRHWPDRPEVRAGLDEEAGGSWLGMNDDGVVAGILNRRGSLGPATGKRSRGELVLEALDHAEAGTAALALADLDPAAYRTFNLVVADERAAFWLRNQGEEGPGSIEVFPLPPGLSVLTAGELDDPTSPRIRAHLPRLRAASAPDPEAGDWTAWQEILSSRHFEAGDGPYAAMCIVTDEGFATVSSSLIGLPDRAAPTEGPPRRPVWLFAPGRPDKTGYAPVEL